MTFKLPAYIILGLEHDTQADEPEAHIIASYNEDEFLAAVFDFNNYNTWASQTKHLLHCGVDVEHSSDDYNRACEAYQKGELKSRTRPHIEPKPKSQSGASIKFRPHTGGLQESLEQVELIGSLEDLVQLIKTKLQGLYDLNKINVDTVTVTHYCGKTNKPDQWDDTWLVELTDYGIIGYTSAEVK